MSELPERIWAWLDQTELAHADGIPEGEWTGDEAPAFPHTEYIKASTLSALQEQNRALREALDRQGEHLSSVLEHAVIHHDHYAVVMNGMKEVEALLAATKQEGGE